MCTSDKQKEVAKFISEEKLQTILCIIENIGSHIVSFVSFVYAANGNIERRNLWADLNRHKQITNGKPWVMGGDMNVILNTNEHSTRVSFLEVVKKLLKEEMLMGSSNHWVKVMLMRLVIWALEMEALVDAMDVDNG
ncbi:RNA-directed DNA polymerase, eukaryota, reverse transcriptase zinc-binding domain protein [Tanacetum coccineum]